jgi:hypothetical protein
MALDLVSMRARSIININATRSNVAPCAMTADDVQEIPTPQGYLVIQIRALCT